jgi:hypothetical protein
MESLISKTKVECNEYEIIEHFNEEIDKLLDAKGNVPAFGHMMFYEKEGKGQRFCSFCLLVKVLYF